MEALSLLELEIEEVVALLFLELNIELEIGGVEALFLPRTKDKRS